MTNKQEEILNNMPIMFEMGVDFASGLSILSDLPLKGDDKKRYQESLENFNDFIDDMIFKLHTYRGGQTQ